MRIGLVGYGGMGRHHARQIAANPEMALAAVADADEGARGRASEAHRVPVYASLDELLDGTAVDGIVIVAPTFLHRPLIETAARAGKHVFSEKPLCLHPEDAEPIRQAIEGAGVTFGFGLVLRYIAPFVRACEMIRRGEIGRVMLAHARYGAQLTGVSYVFAPEVGGGLLNEHTIHMIDALEYLLGPARAVSASLSRVEGRGTEDNAAILFSFEGGLGATLAASGITRWPSGVEITGTEREIAVVNNSRLEEMTADGRREIPVPEAGDPYGLEVDEWRRAISEGRAPRTGLKEALRITAVLAAIHRAASTGQTVTL